MAVTTSRITNVEAMLDYKAELNYIISADDSIEKAEVIIKMSYPFTFKAFENELPCLFRFHLRRDRN